MKYLPLLLVSVIYSQDVQQVSESKRDVAYGQDCDDTEYRNEWGTPNWKNYGVWLSECDSIRTVTLDKEFTERRKKQQREKAIQDSIEALEYENIDFDMDAMWENTVWEEIQDVTTVYAEVEQVTAVAGVRGAEAEDEALDHLYYRRSMKGLALIDLQKALGKLIITKDNLIKIDPNHPKLEKIDNLISQLEIKIKKV
jgi:hypothetical protein|tara:strand:+ start:877 stop:1470 length:594 start_codon:yes stop_codon:yes gene_type:complete